MRKKILDAFKQLGFKMENLCDSTYGFTYEGRNCLLFLNEKNEEFMSIALPLVAEMDKFGELTENDVMDKLNSSVPFIKAYLAFGVITLFYERELIGEENLENVVRRMILGLETGLYFAQFELLVFSDEENSDDIWDLADVESSDDSRTSQANDEEDIA